MSKDAPEHDDILRFVPRPPAGEPVMPRGDFPDKQGWPNLGNNHPVCAVLGCNEAVPKASKKGVASSTHKSNVCKAHQRATVWLVRRGVAIKVRLCTTCNAWKPPAGFTGAHCGGCAARPEKPTPVEARDSGAAWTVYAGQPAPDHTEWLLLRTDRGPGEQCRVLGCTDMRGDAKSRVCNRHVRRLLWRECRAGEEHLVGYCRCCRAWQPASSALADGRCSVGCRKIGGRRVRAKHTTSAEAVRVSRLLESHGNVLPTAPAALARLLLVDELDDGVVAGAACRVVTNGGAECPKPHKGHLSRMCRTHLTKVVVRRSDGLVCRFCSDCCDLVGVTAADGGECPACVAVRSVNALALAAHGVAGSGDRAQDGGAASAAVAESGGVDGEATVSGGGDPAPAAAAASAVATLLPAAASVERPSAGGKPSPQGSSSDDDDDMGWGAVGALVEPRASDRVVDQAQDVPAAAGPSSAVAAATGTCCRGPGCGRAISRGSALGGYCIICVCTGACRGCTLDLAVLATFPGCLAGGIGASQACCWCHCVHGYLCECMWLVRKRLSTAVR